MDADLDAIAHGRAYGISGERRDNLSECLEQPASDNGVDMHKYNTLYIFKFNEHDLTPEYYDIRIAKVQSTKQSGIIGGKIPFGLNINFKK